MNVKAQFVPLFIAILVVVEALSHFTYLLPIRKKTADAVVAELENLYKLRQFKILVTDQGDKEFFDFAFCNCTYFQVANLRILKLGNF